MFNNDYVYGTIELQAKDFFLYRSYLNRIILSDPVNEI